MDNKFNKIFLGEAINIGEELFLKRNIEKNGISWNTLTLGENLNVVSTKSFSLYSGASGVALFFLELYKQTENLKYLNIAKEGIKWAEDFCYENRVSFAFYTGGLGVVFALLKIYETTQEQIYLRKALKLCRKLSGLWRELDCQDLLNGSAGSLIVLLYLHSFEDKSWLIELINNVLSRLIEKAYIGPIGLYWDRSPDNIRGLCGFSHGSAGIGFVFLELGHYFQNEAFYYIAELAFAYENYFFNNKLKNWPDFRKLKQSREEFDVHKNAFLNFDVNFFTKQGDMNAWCHGAAGIGFSRLRAKELLHKNIYDQNLKDALCKIKITDIKKGHKRKIFIYCHGKCGNAELLIEAFKYYKNKDYLKQASKIAFNILEFKKTGKTYRSGLGYADAEGKYDSSLLMGYAGIGYYFLRLSNPDKTPCILFPRINSVCRKNSLIRKKSLININLTRLKKMVLNKSFEKTIIALDKTQPLVLEKYFKLSNQSNDLNYIKTFTEFIRNADLNSCSNDIIKDIFKLENKKIMVENNIKSCSYLDMKSIILKENFQELSHMPRESFSNIEFIIDSGIKIVKSKFNYFEEDWVRIFEKDKIEKMSIYGIIKPSTRGVSVYPISNFVFLILSAFKTKNSVKGVLEQIMENVEDYSPENFMVLSNQILKQIKELVFSQILIEKKYLKQH